MRDAAVNEQATRLVLTYDPAAIDDVSRYWVEDELSKDAYAGYVRRTYDRVRPGETFEEFVSKGCSVPIAVTLRVERVEGGSRVGGETAVEIRRRE